MLLFHSVVETKLFQQTVIIICIVIKITGHDYSGETATENLNPCLMVWVHTLLLIAPVLNMIIPWILYFKLLPFLDFEVLVSTLNDTFPSGVLTLSLQDEKTP